MSCFVFFSRKRLIDMNSCKYNEISKLFTTHKKREKKKADTYRDRLAMLFFLLLRVVYDTKPLRQTLLK